MEPVKHDFTLYQGTFTPLTFQLTDDADVPLDLTGYTARMQARTTVNSSEVQLEASLALGNAEVDGPTGTVKLQFSAAQTAAIKASKLVYDVELTPADGKTVRVMEGSITVSKEVTRA